MALQAAYFTVLSLLALYGLHRLSLTWLFLRGRDGQPETAKEPETAWPTVTVQLPIFNEYYVVDRLLSAACDLRYPAGQLEIQVLDDSTDATSDRVADRVASYRARGHDIHHLRRSRREGFKAGALAEGLARARGELIAIFDADFVPPADFLERTVPRFASGASRLGMLQARWGHINRKRSLLTRAQALLLDGHFVVEQEARSRAGRFLNFNGTAGIFRRRCLEEAGGWRADTLTEDLDLSYRAQLAGWRFEYLSDIVVPAELPVELNSLRSQQRRWAKGSIQTALKLVPRLLAASIPISVKLEGLVHLTNNVAYLLLAILAVLIVPALAARDPGATGYLLWDLPLFLLGTGSVVTFCVVAQRATRSDWWRALAGLPVMMAIGIGLCLNNAAAVIEAGLGIRSDFHRTPKFGQAAGVLRDGRWTALAYRGPRSAIRYLEATFALYLAAGIAGALDQGRYTSLPFLLLFECGFLYVVGLGVAQDLSRRLTSWSAPPEAARGPDVPPPAPPHPRG